MCIRDSHGHGGEPAEVGAEPGLVEGAAGQRAGRGQRPGAELPAVRVDEHPRSEGPQDQAGQARGPVELRVRGVEQLPDPVQPESVDVLGGHPAAGIVGRLQNGDRDPCRDQVVCRRES